MSISLSEKLAFCTSHGDDTCCAQGFFFLLNTFILLWFFTHAHTLPVAVSCPAPGRSFLGQFWTSRLPASQRYWQHWGRSRSWRRCPQHTEHLREESQGYIALSGMNRNIHPLTLTLGAERMTDEKGKVKGAQNRRETRVTCGLVGVGWMGGSMCVKGGERG